MDDLDWEGIVGKPANLCPFSCSGLSGALGVSYYFWPRLQATPASA